MFSPPTVKYLCHERFSKEKHDRFFNLFCRGCSICSTCQQNREQRRQLSSPYLRLFNFHELTDDKHESFLFVISKSDRGSNYTSTTWKLVTIMQAGFQGSRKNFFSVIYIEKIWSRKPKSCNFKPDTKSDWCGQLCFVNSLKSWQYTWEMRRRQHL